MNNPIDSMLEAIFRRTGLKRIDGNALYAYRIETAELLQLRHDLRQELLRNPCPAGSDVCAAFFLFAAEWFRRNHEDGPWKWEPIFEIGLGLTGESLRRANTQVNRSRMVELGLQWWNLPLVETEGSTRYLVSLACQGGLPLKTLKKDNGNLKRFFEDSLAHHERWPTEPLNDVVSSRAQELPVSLNNDVVIQLGVLIVAAVAKLRRDSRAASESSGTRMAYLDQHCPRWRDSLPLRLDEDDQEPLQLLMGLLDKKPVRSATDDFPKVETMLTISYSSATVSRNLSAGTCIEEEGLARFLGLSDKQDLRPRMTLCLTAGCVRTPVAKLAKRATGSEFVVNAIQGHVAGPAALKEVRVTAASGADFTPPMPLTGGQELGDLPWIFAETDDGKSSIRLIGLGSVRTTRESVIVVVPVNARCHCEGSAEELPQGIDGRKIVRVSGDLVMSVEDTVFRVRTKQLEESASCFWLTGRQVSCGIGGSVVWAGVPRILEVASDGTVQEVASRSIQWKYEIGGAWSSGFSGCIGRVKTRIVRDGVTVFQQYVDVFPHEFSTKVLPVDTRAGRLVFRGIGSKAKLFVQPHGNLNSEVISTATEATLTCKVTSGERPDFIQVRFVFENQGASEIQVPCPTTWIGLVDAGRQVYAQGRPVPLSVLNHLTLRVISPRAQMPELVSGSRATFLGRLRQADKEAEGIFELPMSVVATRISGIMSATSDMDDVVSLGIRQGNSTEPIFRFSVSRYPGSVEKVQQSFAEADSAAFTDIFLPDNEVLALRISDHQLRMELAPLARPDKPYMNDECRQIAPYRWRIFHDQLQPGPCLVTPWLDDFTCLRPLRISVKTESEATESTPNDPGSVEAFERTSGLWNRDVRRAGWKNLVEDLSENFEAAAWTRIDALLNASIHRPLTTFEAITTLVQNPMAMARIGITHAGKQWVWDRMEELPFLWCLIPIHCWVKAALRIRQSSRARLALGGFSDEQIDELLLSQLRNFLEGGVGRPAVLSTATLCLPFADSTIPQDPNYHLLLPGSRQGLLHERDRARTRLISAHDGIDTRISWPHYEVPIARELLDDVRHIFISDCHENQGAVLNGPAAAAGHSVYGVPVTEEQLTRFQELRGIDPEWFDRCFEITSCLLAGQRFMQNRNWIKEA